MVCLPFLQLREQGVRRVVLLSNQGSLEWFVQRNFDPVENDANWSELLPAKYAASSHTQPLQTQLYVKSIVELDESVMAKAGKRIGF